jgi:hypothetical protein
MDDPIPNPLQDDFLKSWDGIEYLFSHVPDVSFRDQSLHFIAELRHAGHDRRFRAGQSLFALILSRARHHGLRRDQASVTFIVYGSMMKMSLDRGRSWTRDMPMALTAEVELVLTELLNHPID